MSLADLNLRAVYNHSNCPDLVAGLYEPLLAQAVRYDRTTYTFTAQGLIAAAAGAAGFIRNGGRIRLICDHTVRDDVLQAIRDGQLDAADALRQTAPREDLLLTDADDITNRTHLELAYWLVANGVMEVKVAIRDRHIFHNKSGIVEDVGGNRVAFVGSLNETLSGWRGNWESVYLYQDSSTIEHLDATEAEFQALWQNRAAGLCVIDLPAYYQEYIAARAPAAAPEIRAVPERRPAYALNDYWRRIYQALADDPDSTVATVPATLWPHQERFRQQNIGSAAIRRLIADEVGLGKTMPAGIILKTRLNQGRAGRALVIAPKAAVKQWQSELLMKFAIDAPIVDAQGRHYRDGRREPPAVPPWNAPLAIAGHQWLVRHAAEFLAGAGEYDIIIVDEAHRARFTNVDLESRRQDNKYLAMLRQLTRRTRELLLLTATPMQLNEAELWALLELLEPDGWNATEYRRFHQDAPEDAPDDTPPDLAEWQYRRDLWRKTAAPEAGDFLLASDNDDYLASRLDDPVPQRQTEDVTIAMTAAERRRYDQIKPLVRQCCGGRHITPQALGFITTIFRKRMGSSTCAYARTRRHAAHRIQQDDDDLTTVMDDADRDELTDDETAVLNQADNRDALLDAAAVAEKLSRSDSKRSRLNDVIQELRAQGHAYILMFTQFRDTQSWLSEYLQPAGHYVTELYGQDRHLGDRGLRLADFRQQRQGILLCTETASESLNRQFCSAVVNYDIPWHPMTLEQRAGRIDRIGQERPAVAVVNLFYRGSAEHDAYAAVARRFASIRSNVGEYPPIIAAGIQQIIRDEADPEAMLDRLAARREFDINRLNADWEDTPNAPVNPQITIEHLEQPLRQQELLPAGWSAQPSGGKHWDLTDPAGRTTRITTDPEAYQNSDGRLQWWAGPQIPR